MIADHYRDALALIPAARRLIDPHAVGDHLLFRAASGTHTYVTAIGRLGHGEHLRWQNGRAVRRIFDPLVARPQADREPLDLVDVGLSKAIGRLPVTRGCVNQLSGGIDSSLLQTYLPTGTSTASGTIDSPEFAVDRAYAERASRLLRTNHKFVAVEERDYLSLIVDVIRRCGVPIRMPQTAVYYPCFQLPAASFMNGQGAGAVFGLTPSLHYVDCFDQRRWLRLAEALRLALLLPTQQAKGLRRRIGRLRRIEAAVGDREGLGPRYAIVTNWELAERILGAQTVRERIDSRAVYVAERFHSEERDENPLFAHLEFGHVLSLLTDEPLSNWRQLMHTHGKCMLAPFACRSVVEAALAVPRSRRYVANGRMKYLLKDLLKRRLPAFEVDVRKATGDLPLGRYFLDGPLKAAFERYAMPDFVDRDVAAATCAAPDWLTWNLLSFAIWRDEVLSNAALALSFSTRVFSPSSSAR
ncbi:MAG: asparagine synthase-related protein [Dongiaceae bacterium]